MGIFFRGKHTELADTPIVEAIAGFSDQLTRITKVAYTAAGTAHIGTVMKAVGRTEVIEQSLAGVATLKLENVQPGLDATGQHETLAADDWVIFADRNNVWYAQEILSVSGSTITLTANLAGDVLVGANVWAMYELLRPTHIQVNLPANARASIDSMIWQGGFAKQQGEMTSRNGRGDPLILHIDNATAAGTLEELNGEWVPFNNALTVQG